VTVHLVVGPSGLVAGPKAIETSVGDRLVLRLSSKLPGEQTLFVTGYLLRGELEGSDEGEVHEPVDADETQMSFATDKIGDFPIVHEEKATVLTVLHVRP